MCIRVKTKEAKKEKAKMNVPVCVGPILNDLTRELYVVD